MIEISVQGCRTCPFNTRESCAVRRVDPVPRQLSRSPEGATTIRSSGFGNNCPLLLAGSVRVVPQPVDIKQSKEAQFELDAQNVEDIRKDLAANGPKSAILMAAKMYRAIANPTAVSALDRARALVDTL